MGDELTPMMRQYREIKDQHSDKILFFRLGDFYEMFDEDARTASGILQLALTKRHDIPMCGIPHHAAANYIRRLIEAGYKIAVCEQMEEPGKGKTIVRRDVRRIITPGTLIDEFSLNSSANNFLAAVFAESGMQANGCRETVFLAADCSTGDLEITHLVAGSEGDLENLLCEYKPRELLVSENQDFFSKIKGSENMIINRLPAYVSEKEYAVRKIKAAFGLSSLKGLGIEESPLLSGCLSQALYYLEDTQKESISHLKIPQIRRRDGHMFLDSATIKNLELAVNNLDQTERFTLLEAIDCACTPMGKRRLRRWIMEPLIIQEQIEFRLSRADFFYKHPSLLREARKILGCISDLERTGARLVLKKAQPREIVALKHSLTYAMQFFKALESGGYDNERISALPNPEPLITDIETVMLEEPSVMPDEGGLIKPGVDARLDEYLASKRDGKTWLLELQKEEAEKSGINTLKIKYNRVFGYYFEITKSHLSNVPVHFIKKQTLANAERFTTEKLQSYEQIILEAEEKSAALEQEIFISLRERLACAIKIIQQLACEIAFVDVIASYAQNALEKKYCCPQITDENILFIKNGRHPVIESCLQSDFIPNDLEMNPDYAVHIITGPNMSGKSTYLRQNALIVLMAQIGSWVPAEEAKIGIVDRIFTRIGASDNLARGESTFLVEMAEAANILNNATGRSLVIMDEIGRGTSTYDGLSLAWAIIEYIIDNPQLSCKTLFATHYHELTGLEKFRGVKNFNVAVKEWKNSVVFLKKVICGAADRSYGIHVAKLAGMPDEVIRRASIILKDLESFSGKTAGAIECDLGRLDKQCEKDQLFFVDPHTEVVIEKLRSYDINNTTPVEALNFLSALKKDL